MGDTNEPELFKHNYARPVTEWLRATHATTKPLIARSPLTTLPANASIGIYEDDLLRLLLLDDPRLAVPVFNADAAALDAAVAPWRYAQNAAKAEIISTIRSRTCARALATSTRLVGKHLPELVHLGAWLSGSGSNTPEIRKRIQQCNAGWFALEPFFMSAAPRPAKRLLLLVDVYSRLLSGVEALALTAADVDKLTRGMNGKLRALHLGKAHKVDNAGEHTA